jgi:outer membrane protein assembly factor BamB
MDVSPRNDNFDPKAAINASSALKWHYGGADPDPNADREYLFGRTMSTCAVHDGLCYAADSDGYFYCLDAETGKKLWEHEMRADTWSSPYWVGGHVYLGNERAKVHVFKHGRRKEVVRSVPTGVPPSTRIRATPVAAGGVLYLVTENPCRLWAIEKR